MIGDAIRPGNYVKHSVFQRVANYTCETGLVSLVDKSVGAGPFNLVVSQAPVIWPDTIEITDNTIGFDGVSVKTETLPVYESSLEPINAASTHIETLKRWLGIHAPQRSLAFLLDENRISDFTTSVELAFADRMVQVAQTWRTGAFTAAVAMAKGCGFGLTPSGDDFNAGLITGLHVLKQTANRLNNAEALRKLDGLINEMSIIVPGTNPLVNAFLNAAVHGQVNELQKELILSLSVFPNNHLIEFVEKFIAIGATSGTDWLTGYLFIFEKEFESWLSLAE